VSSRASRGSARRVLQQRGCQRMKTREIRKLPGSAVRTSGAPPSPWGTRAPWAGHQRIGSSADTGKHSGSRRSRTSDAAAPVWFAGLLLVGLLCAGLLIASGVAEWYGNYRAAALAGTALSHRLLGGLKRAAKG